MKKIISTLAATMMAAASLPYTVASAINIPVLNEYSLSVGAAGELGALASSLGADTDYLNIPYIKETTINPDGKKGIFR